MKKRNYSCCSLIWSFWWLLLVLSSITSAHESLFTSEIWARKSIEVLKGNGQDVRFLKDLDFTPNSLIVWSCKPTPSTKMEVGIPEYMHIFFMPHQIKEGNVLGLYFRNAFSSGLIHFLPQKQADQIPFSMSQYPAILTWFGFHMGSQQAQAIHEALYSCEEKHVRSTIQFCATSYESLLSNVVKNLGSFSEKPVRVLSTSKLPPSAHTLQNYTVTHVKLVRGGEHSLVCHLLTYPYAVFFCHRPAGATKVYEISLAAEDGTQVEAVATCHLNTSYWNPHVEAFRYLGTKPGDPVCHALPPADLLWVPGGQQ